MLVRSWKCSIDASGTQGSRSAFSRSDRGSASALSSPAAALATASRPRTTPASTSSTTPRSTAGGQVGDDHGRGDRRARLAAPHATSSRASSSGASRTSVNTRNTLNRKYLLHAVDGSLRRLGLDFLDLIFCHRPDPETPIEETVRAMHDIITLGQGPVLGHVGVERRRRSTRRGTSPIATTSTSR